MGSPAIYPKLLARLLLGAQLLICASPATAADKIPVGVILTGDIPYYREIHESLVAGLTAERYGPETIDIILQKPVPNAMSWTNAVRKLVTFDAKVIVSYGAPATLTAVSESSGIPVVFAGVYMPEDLGISLRNATGVSSEVPVASVLKKLHAIVAFSTLGIIFSASETDTVLQARKVQAFAESMSFIPTMIDLSRKTDGIDFSGLDALFMSASCAAMSCVEDIVGRARAAKIPTATLIGGAADKGVLLTISANAQEQGVVASSMVAAVLEGRRPADIPPRKATKIDFVVNLREADSLGLKIPFDVLTSATRAIK